MTETSYLEDDVSDDYDIADLEFYILLNKSGRDDISKENIEYEPWTYIENWWVSQAKWVNRVHVTSMRVTGAVIEGD